MALIDNIVVFVVSLLIGALGIYLGARTIVDVDDYSHAIVTALIGAIVWGVLGALIGWIPLVGPLIVFVAYLAVVNWRYPGGWVQAAAIALVAWIAALLVLSVLAFLDLTAFEAVGIPGT